jgi:hypothetical protein
VRLLGLIALFLLALGGKEIAITLPGVLFVLELYRRSDVALLTRLRSETPTYVALTGTLALYVLTRAAHDRRSVSAPSQHPRLVAGVAR